MRITRPFHRSWGTHHPLIHVTEGGQLLRCGTVALASWDANDAGPTYKGMDPSDPLTYVREWRPQPGMIAYLNFDGASMQGRTPAGGLQRGSQRRGARGSA